MQIRPIPPGAAAPAAPTSRATPGFASFLQDARPDPTALDAGLEADFNEWKASLADRGVNQGRIDAIEASADAFLDLVKRANRHNGLADPRSFLQSLSRDELATIQRIQGAQTDDIASLSDEGARNLLAVPGQEVDLDQDGMITKGKIRMFSFPPPGAPDDIKTAWKRATAGMEIDALVMAQSALWLFGWGAHGAMAGKDAASVDYRALADAAIDNLEANKLHQSAEHRAVSERNIATYRRFLDHLA